MPMNILMPPLSQTKDTLVLVQWLKEVGERVKKGEPLFAVETDKATLEVEAPAEGRLAAIWAYPGEEVRAGAVIGQIAGEGEALEAAAAAPLPGTVGAKALAETETRGTARTTKRPRMEQTGARERVLASPRARRLLSEEGIELGALKGWGSGPQGAVVERDVLAYLRERKTGRPEIKAAPVPAGLPGRGAAAAGSEDLRGSYAATFTREADAARLLEVREHILKRLKAGQPQPEVADFLALIACRLLARYPTLHGRMDGDREAAQTEVHLALGVESAQGMLFPVVQGAGRLGLFELARARLKLAERARQGRLQNEDLRGATFMLIALSGRGADTFMPALIFPQKAALGVGRVRQTGAGALLRLALSCDLRGVSAEQAAGFLEELAMLIEAPEMVLAL